MSFDAKIRLPETRYLHDLRIDFSHSNLLPPPESIKEFLIKDLKRIYSVAPVLDPNATCFNHDEIYKNNSFANDLDNILRSLPFEELRLLHQILRPIFTDKVDNEHRNHIFLSFKGVSSDSWIKLGKQIQFLMPPHDSEGKDIAVVTQKLAEIEDIKYRDFLVNVAHKFYDWDSESFERVNILNILSQIDLESLKAFDALSAEVKTKFLIEIRNNIKIFLHHKPSVPSEMIL